MKDLFPFFEKPWPQPPPPGALSPSFTLIELMAASTVLSLVLLMMVGMQDQMSRAWSNANRRTEATREASAACRLMAADLSCLVIRPQASDNQAACAAGLENQGLPFLYSSNGAGPISISSTQSNSAYIFCVVGRNPSSNSPADLAIVGYFHASGLSPNVNGFVTTNYNLFRHYLPPSNAISNLSAWFAAPTNARSANLLFAPNPTNVATDEILARNTCNLRITAYNRQDGNTQGYPNRVANGLNYQFVSAGSSSFYSGSKIQVEMSVLPEEYAQKIVHTNWGTSTNIQKYARSYEFRVDVPRD